MDDAPRMIFGWLDGREKEEARVERSIFFGFLDVDVFIRFLVLRRWMMRDGGLVVLVLLYRFVRIAVLLT
jgi:hypothetical protein